jgi:LysM repeat protein
MFDQSTKPIRSGAKAPGNNIKKYCGPLFAFAMLALASLACTLGAEPTAIPTVPPTFTEFVIITVAPITTNTPEATITSAPATSAPCTRRTDWIAYRAQAGDTLGSLATRTGSTISILAAANCLTNVNLIEVGQLIYVPRTPSTVTPGPTPTRTPGGVLPSIQGVLVQPATVQGGQFQVLPGNVTVTAIGVANAVKVTFYIAPTSTVSNPTVLGEDTNLADGASIVWSVSDQEFSVNIWATATSSTNQTAQAAPIAVVRLKPPAPPKIGVLTITPSTFESGVYKVKPGPVVVSVSGVQDAVRVRFYYAAHSGTTIVLGEDTNLADGVGITWNVPSAAAGDVYAEAINSAGQIAKTGTYPIADAEATG